MLKQRIITACALAVLVSAIVLLSSSLVFAGFIGLVVALACWEWANLSGIAAAPLRLLYALVVIAVLGVSWWLLPSQDWLAWAFAVACVGWLSCLIRITFYPAGAGVLRRHWLSLLTGFLVLVPAGHALVYLHSLAYGEWLVVTLITTVAAADIGAYFTGKRFGRRRLAPRVSPGKTWEGVAGGAVFAVVFLGVAMANTVSYPLYWAALLGLPVALVSVVGDLFESMLKRERGIKDSGRILPGHGGVLDRIDGLLAAAPVFALVILLAGWSV